jgi:hypothetical protein
MTALRKIVSRKAAATVPHGVQPQIVVTLYPPTDKTGATIGLREHKRARATELFVDVGTLYVRSLQNKMAGERLKKASAKARERKLRRALR